MPYQIEQRNEQYCVIETNTGEDVGCHPTEAAAQEHLAALYANVSDAKEIERTKAYRMRGDTLKALDGGRVGGYLVRFTDDTQPDLTGEYFTKSTEFYRELYPIKGSPIMVEHGLDETAGILPIGLIDIVKEDDAGIWVEGRLKDKQDYLAMLREMRGKRNLALSDDELLTRAALCETTVKQFFDTCNPQWSSGALPQSVEVEPRGNAKWIKKWAIWEASATVSPAEPNGTEITNTLKTLRDTLALKETATSKEAQKTKSTLLKPNHKGTKMDTPEVEVELSPAEDQMKADDMMKACVSKANELVTLLGRLMEQGGYGAMDAEQKAAATDAMVEEMKRVTYGVNNSKSFYAALNKSREDAFLKGQAAAAAVQEKRKEEEVKLAEAAFKKMQPTTPQKSNVGGYQGGGTPRIDNMRDLRYAHLSAGDMAFGVMALMAARKKAGFAPTLDGLNVSEDYLKHMAHKARDYADSNPYKSAQDNATIKSIVPYKTNELDASNIVGQGAEWVGEFWSSEIWKRERFQRVYDRLVQKGMMVKELGRGVETGHFPTEGNDPVAYTAPQANSVDATGRPETTININPFTTGEVVITPNEIKIATSATFILDEDSAIAIAPQVNYQLQEAALETRDKLLINGDTATAANTNINLIDGTPAVGLNTPYYIASGGFRKLPLVTATAQSRSGGTLDIDDYRLTLQLLAAELRQYRDRLIYIIDPDTENTSLALPAIATDDVRRTAATITSGVLMNIYGIDVATSGFLPLSNTAGKVSATAGNNTKGTILLVYAPYWAVAYKRQITVETDRDVYSGSNVYVASMRIGIAPRGTNAASLTYNLTIA